MKISFLSENLQKALALTNHAVSTKNQLPILSHVLLETREGKIYLSATDLEIGIETVIQGVIEEAGSATIPAKLFLELVNTLPAGKVSLVTQEGSVQIVGGKTKTTLQTVPPEEFPKLYERKGEKILSLPGKSLQNVLKRILFTASIESTRPALSGILFKRIELGFILVATDGYRLSLEKITTEEQAGFEGSIIIPAKLIKEVLSLREDAPIDVYVDGQQNQILVAQEETVFIGRLIDAEFPNYEKILPTDASTEITVDKDVLQRAVKTCAIFARETANIITLSIQKEKMSVSSKAPSLGENVVDVDMTLKGEENDIAFNARYLLDFLAVADTQDIRFEMTGPLNSGVFRLAGNASYLHLIMPIRV